MPLPPTKTPIEKKLTNLDRRDKIFRIYIILVLSLVVLFVIISMLSLRTMARDNKNNVNSHNDQVKGLLAENRIRGQEQAERDKNVHEELKRYIECIVLIRFALTPEQLEDQEAVKTALKDCAATSKVIATAPEIGDTEVQPALMGTPRLPQPQIIPNQPAPTQPAPEPPKSCKDK